MSRHDFNKFAPGDVVYYLEGYVGTTSNCFLSGRVKSLRGEFCEVAPEGKAKTLFFHYNELSREPLIRSTSIPQA